MRAMPSESRRTLTPDEERRVRFWVDALLHGQNPARAAQELHAIGIRTRGAIRTRGSALTSANSRFPPGTPTADILQLLRTQVSHELRIAVAAALSEWGGS